MTNFEVNGWKLVDNGNGSFTITRPDTPVKGAACVTRTTEAGRLFHLETATIDDDFNVVKGELILQGTPKTTEEDILKSFQRNHEGAKAKVISVDDVTGRTVGIPKEIFSAIAVEALRPDSQK